MNHKGFEPIASYYDVFVQCTSGQLLVKNGECLFSEITDATTVLVVGDGSGKITEKFLRQHSVTTLYYIELSETLLSKAKKRLDDLLAKEQLSTTVHYWNQDIFNTTIPSNRIDVIITPYFLDLWKEDQLSLLVEQLSRGMKEDGVWYVSDFNPDIFREKSFLYSIYRLLIRMLYTFFRWTVQLQTTSLPDMDTCFGKLGYRLIQKKVMCKGLLVSMIWKRG